MYQTASFELLMEILLNFTLKNNIVTDNGEIHTISLGTLLLRKGQPLVYIGTM